MICPAGLADEALSALEAKAMHAQALDAELAELRAALDLRDQQVAEHAAEAQRLSQEVAHWLSTSQRLCSLLTLHTLQAHGMVLEDCLPPPPAVSCTRLRCLGPA